MELDMGYLTHVRRTEPVHITSASKTFQLNV